MVMTDRTKIILSLAKVSVVVYGVAHYLPIKATFMLVSCLIFMILIHVSQCAVVYIRRHDQSKVVLIFCVRRRNI